MPFHTYILWSRSRRRFYIGHTENLEARIQYHNSGHVKWTSSGTPWELAFSEKYETRSEAMRRENQLKAWKSTKSIQALIDSKRDL